MSPQKRQNSLIFQLCVCRVRRVLERALRNCLGTRKTVLAMWGTFRGTDPIILSGHISRKVKCPKMSQKIWPEIWKFVFVFEWC